MHKSFSCLCCGIAGFDYFDYVINILYGNQQTRQYFCSVFCGFLVKLCALENNFSLICNIVRKNFVYAHLLWLSVCNGNHIYSITDLQICIFEQIVQNFVSFCVFFKANYCSDTLSVTLVTDITNTTQKFLVGIFKSTNLFEKFGFVDTIRKLVNNNYVFVFIFFYVCFCPYDNFATTCLICSLKSFATKHNSACWEIWTFDILHKFCGCHFWIVYKSTARINTLTQIVSWYVCGKTYGNSCCTIYKQIWKSAWQNIWFVTGIVIVFAPTNCVFVNIFQKFKCKRGKSGFGVSVCSSTIAIYTTKVSVSINKHFSHIEILRKTHHCIVN